MKTLAFSPSNSKTGVNRLIICGYSNAKHRLWENINNKVQYRALDKALTDTNLTIINTKVSTRLVQRKGEINIDISLVSPNVIPAKK